MIQGIKKLYSNFLNSINGLKVALNEHSFIVEIIGGIFLIPFLIIVEVEFFFKVLIVIIYFLLLAFELLNTSIEKLSDKVNQKFDLDIRIIKDVSSAAVFLVLMILVFLIIFSINV